LVMLKNICGPSLQGDQAPSI